ncbi:MAG: GAF domain-containing sensor histidine kinase, partial [Gemmatimonadaceae bacterium]
LQAVVTLGLISYCAFLYRRYQKEYFLWFSTAWSLYFLRLAAISAFLLSQNSVWLYWHQVLTGWTALALLWASLVFSRQLRFRRPYLLALLFPLGWSYVAIYALDNFLSAALPAVLFLAIVTAWTGVIFFRHWRSVHAPGAAVLSASFLLWSVHHLDYPFLRARGAWNPWGYYLDIVFLLLTGAAMTVLVMDDLRQGLRALTSLAGGVRGASRDDVLRILLEQACTLPAAAGAAFFTDQPGEVRCQSGAGACAGWEGVSFVPAAIRHLADVIEAGRPAVLHDWSALPEGRRFAFAAMIPVMTAEKPVAALLIVGDARDPFAALDDEFLLALGRQIGSALEGAELTHGLRERSDELARLSARMTRQYEEERRRLSRELHDETAQVFASVKLQLGVLQERTGGDIADGLSRALDLVDTGMRGIRSVTETLRPTVLDELGLAPALRSLVADTAERCQLDIRLSTEESLPDLSGDAELALYRAMQESLSNVVRHAGATSVAVSIRAGEGGVQLVVRDDGIGLTPLSRAPDARMVGGLAGMRERVFSLGGTLTVASTGASGGGTEVRIWVPARVDDAVVDNG